MKNNNIDSKYQKLNDIEHVLLRPFMYIGSISNQIDECYLYDGNNIEKLEVEYNPGLIKIFDEIISNSVDEHRRNSKLNEIKVTINLDNYEISIWDNGGIPVKIHSVYKEWIPEMIFSNLKSGSNFNDSEGRIVAGMNGVGSTITNIFSKKFSISTCDGKNKFEQTFYNNMTQRTKPNIIKSNKGFTQISFIPDLEKFGMNEINETIIKIFFKRCLDIAACNNKLSVTFSIIKNNELIISKKLKFNNFQEYIKLYCNEYFYEESDNWKIGFAKSENGFNQISFVNSVYTRDGGTHVDYIINQLIFYLREIIRKKYKIEVKPSDIKNYLFVFVNCNIINPKFSSQTKEKLISNPKEFETQHKLSEKLAKLIFKSDIIISILNWIENKKLEEERAELKKLNKKLHDIKVPRLIDAQKRGDRSQCILGIYEGLSALSAVRKFRDPQLIGAFPLKGKFINVSEMNNSEIIKNEEAVQLMAALGLKLGEPPISLRYGKIYIYTDADPDGNHIAATLINFFNKFWPELFIEGRIYKVMTPIMIAKKSNKILNFYTLEEFNNWQKNNSIIGWNIEYKKGLAALEDSEYEQIIKNPNLIKIIKDLESNNSLNIWFGKDSNLRKEKILN